MANSKSILTAGGIVDPTVLFDSLQTLGIERGDHLHFSWAPSHEMDTQLQHWRQMDISLSWETDGRMNMRTAEFMDIIFMNEVELNMYQHQGLVTDAWIKSSKHDVTVVVTLGDAGAESGGSVFSASERHQDPRQRDRRCRPPAPTDPIADANNTKKKVRRPAAPIALPRVRARELVRGG
jgi:hypothetical protein